MTFTITTLHPWRRHFATEPLRHSGLLQLVRAWERSYHTARQQLEGWGEVLGSGMRQSASKGQGSSKDPDALQVCIEAD